MSSTHFTSALSAAAHVRVNLSGYNPLLSLGLHLCCTWMMDTRDGQLFNRRCR
jgi:hypothetical protein